MFQNKSKFIKTIVIYEERDNDNRKLICESSISTDGNKNRGKII